MTFQNEHLPIFQLQKSGQKMKAELEKIFNLYEEFKEAGQAVTLTLASRGGKSTVKLQLESSTSSSSPSPAQPSPPAPGRRRRNRGPRARARRNQRAAAHQASLAEAATSVPLDDPLPPRPLHHLQSPTPESGRRQVTRVERPDLPTFSSLNLDGSSSPPPSSPTSPTTSPPTSSPPPTAPTSHRPPFCHINYKHRHCETCGRCVHLCGEHHGCYCEEEETDKATSCDVCYCGVFVRYTNPADMY